MSENERHCPHVVSHADINGELFCQYGHRLVHYFYLQDARFDQKPKTSAVQFPQSGTRVKGADVVFGNKVAAPGNVAKGGTFAPLTGTQNFE